MILNAKKYRPAQMSNNRQGLSLVSMFAPSGLVGYDLVYVC